MTQPHKKKKPSDSEHLHVEPVLVGEKRAWNRAAAMSKTTLNEWVRKALNSAANKQGVRVLTDADVHDLRDLPLE